MSWEADECMWQNSLGLVWPIRSGSETKAALPSSLFNFSMLPAKLNLEPKEGVPLPNRDPTTDGYLSGPNGQGAFCPAQTVASGTVPLP